MTTLALIIDDEPDIRELLEITLERMNIECRSSDCVSSALKKKKKETFHTIVQNPFTSILISRKLLQRE